MKYLFAFLLVSTGLHAESYQAVQGYGGVTYYHEIGGARNFTTYSNPATPNASTAGRENPYMDGYNTYRSMSPEQHSEPGTVQTERFYRPARGGFE